MPSREHVLVRVLDRQFCIDNNCRSCLYTLFPTSEAIQEVECSRLDCDNHLREHEDEVAPTPLHGLVTLPEEGSTQPLGPELPFSPE